MELKKLNIGCGHNKVTEPGWLNLDKDPACQPDIRFDLDSIELGNLIPLPDNSCSSILMSHVLEHLSRPLPIMEELWRVAAPGCAFVIRVPYGSSDIAFEDPTHVRQYFLNSFMYFGQPAYARADYGYRGDWKVKERILVIDQRVPVQAVPADPDDFIQMASAFRNIIEEFIVVMTPVKPARDPRNSPADAAPIKYGYREDMAK